MFKKILVPTDFSEPSVKIIEKLPRFKGLGLQEVILLYCLQTLNTFVDETYVELSYMEGLQEYAEKELAKLKSMLEAQGIKVTTVIEAGNPAVFTLDVAKRENVDLVVMPSHGHGKAQHFHLGSVTHILLHHLNIPVLIEKVKWLENGDGNIMPQYVGGELFHKIVFPTDFSEHSFNALEALKKMTDVGLKEVVIVHIQDVRKLRPHLENKMDEFNKIDMERLERIKADLEKLNLSVKIILEEGVPFDKITEIAERENANMVLIGSHGRSPFKELLIGSVSERVVLKSHKPVLVVRK